MQNLEGKTAFVTGCASGIGLGVACWTTAAPARVSRTRPIVA